MGEAVDALKSYFDRDDVYDIPHEDIAALQIEAAGELFDDRKTRIKFLAHRAEEIGVTSIARKEDLVGLLFAHTTYKSYPEKWLTEEKWPMLSRWVGTLSSYPVGGVNFEGIDGIDTWIARMGEAGHYLACSSGTSGKSAILDASTVDMEWAKKNLIIAMKWGAPFETKGQYRRFSPAAAALTPRIKSTSEAIRDNFERLDVAQYVSPVPPITLGDITGMVALRKRLSDGIASPSEISDFDQTSKTRQANMERGVSAMVDALIDARGDKVFVAGMWAQIFEVARRIRERGFAAKDFHPQNLLFAAGGLKGAQLPPDYREFIGETFNVPPEQVLQQYSMQEISTSMPRCSAGRYHLPPWLMCLLLDESGEHLIDVRPGENEGRAAFFDFSLDGRWSGVISGDKISLTHDRCGCGNRSPSVHDNIVRYADLAGGDKITCAGTADAYVRGLG